MDQNTLQHGERLEAFVQSMEVSIQKRFNALLKESRGALFETRVSANKLPDLRVVVIAEPWSGDVLKNLPVHATLEESLDRQVQIFRCDEHPDLIEPTLRHGARRKVKAQVV